MSNDTTETLYPLRLNLLEKVYEKPEHYQEISNNDKLIQFDTDYLQEKLNIDSYIELSKLLDVICDGISKIK